jgi:hypothetical protein
MMKEDVACMREKRNACMILVWKPKRKKAIRITNSMEHSPS